MASIIKGVGNFLGITSPPEPTTTPLTPLATRKRSGSESALPTAKFRKLAGSYTIQDYQNAPYRSSTTVTATGEELEGDGLFKAGPSRLKAKPTAPASPTQKASRDKIKAAAEARAALAQRYGFTATNSYKGKGKQRAEPIVEFQPIDDYTESGTDLETPFVEDSGYSFVETDTDLETPFISPATVKPPSKSTQAAPPLPQAKPKAPQKPKGGDTFTKQQKWESRPNLRARDLVRKYKRNAPEVIQAEIEEPEYALRDIEIRDGVWQIMDRVERMTREYFGSKTLRAVNESWYRQLSPQTAKIINCVASGGPAGQQGWHDLFLDEQKRSALVCAIIGNVLVEQVFQHMFFGGQQKEIRAIAALQEKHRDKDGFDRNKYYALAIQELLGSKDKMVKREAALPLNFVNHVNCVAAALWTHLAPFYKLTSRAKDVPEDLLDQLCTIVAQAGTLSLQMRMDPHTVYYFEPTFKEDTFTSERMECFNFHQMQQQHPRHTAAELLTLDASEQHRRTTLSAAEKARARNDSPLTQITLMDGICAYRLGGWEHPSSTTTSPAYEKSEYKRQGVRSRLLTHAWVYCRWGRQRRFEKGVPADKAAVHGTAWNGGFVEFTELAGVYPWLAEERKEKEAAAARAREKVKSSIAKGKGKATTAPNVAIERPGPSGSTAAIGGVTVRVDSPQRRRSSTMAREGRVRRVS